MQGYWKAFFIYLLFWAIHLEKAELTLFSLKPTVFAPTFDCPTDVIIVNVVGTIIEDDLVLINSTAANATCDMLTIDYGTPMAEDNCNVQSTVLNAGIPSGDPFPVGTSIVEFIAFDDSGNFATCAFDIENKSFEIHILIKHG